MSRPPPSSSTRNKAVQSGCFASGGVSSLRDGWRFKFHHERFVRLLMQVAHVALQKR